MRKKDKCKPKRSRKITKKQAESLRKDAKMYDSKEYPKAQLKEVRKMRKQLAKYGLQKIEEE